jgi:hypothetical protein
MNIKSKPVRAFMGGVLILLLPLAVHTLGGISPLLQAQGGGEEAHKNDFRRHESTRSIKGLYGFWYRGF